MSIILSMIDVWISSTQVEKFSVFKSNSTSWNKVYSILKRKSTDELSVVIQWEMKRGEQRLEVKMTSNGVRVGWKSRNCR